MGSSVRGRVKRPPRNDQYKKGKCVHVLAIHHKRGIKLSHVKYVYIIIIVGVHGWQ